MDGVPNYKDKCPNTPRGAKVDSRGCWMIGMIHFDLDKAAIRSEAVPVLNNIVEVMKKNSVLQLKVAGHTCNIGSEIYNDKLSDERANAAKTYLVNHGVDENRIITEGYGYESPIMSNDTEKGREMNRRVEFTPVK
jgi:OOP family OmpA-OmpF porin